MTHFAGKAARLFTVCSLMTLLLTGFAAAAENDLAVGAGVTTGSSLRLRSQASTSSSILTHLDEGITVAVLDGSTDKWYHVRYNGLEGYVSADYLTVDEDNLFETYGRIAGDKVNIRAQATTKSSIVDSLYENTRLTVTGLTDGWYSVTLAGGAQGYVRSDLLELSNLAPVTVGSPSSSAGANAVTDLAKQYLGVRYVYGGASPKSFDCSGFTLYIFKQFGYSLPHSATSQWQSGAGPRVTYSELEPGDIVFFCDPSRSKGKACSHCGIYLGDGEFIHASSSKEKVVVSNLTSGYYNRYFVGGMRLV